MLSVSRATIMLPCMAMTDKSESVVIVDLSQVWSLRREENDLSASVLPIGKTARIFSSSRTLGKKIPSAWLAIMDATDSSGIASCLSILDLDGRYFEGTAVAVATVPLCCHLGKIRRMFRDQDRHFTH